VGQIPITFALDVSGSTEGAVLRAELNVISELCVELSQPDLVSKSVILPWCHQARPPVQISHMDDIRSAGGTNPVVLLNDPVCEARLRSCNLWFLLTDGLIEDELIQSFANTLAEAELHGTACVVVLFGVSESFPFYCNVSVGSSVFALAPHCIFLFHDVQTGLVYVFQAKGCFRTLLPDRKPPTVIDQSTNWGDLTRIRYCQLAQVKVPPPTKLPPNTVILPDGSMFDLEDIYNDTLPHRDAIALLADYPALDVILLTARNRGRYDAVKRWVCKARSACEPAQAWGVNGDAKAALRGVLAHACAPSGLINQAHQMWQNLRASSSSFEFVVLKRKLAHRNQAHWRDLINNASDDSDISSGTPSAFDDILKAMEAFEGSPILSPPMLTPMTSTLPVPQWTSHISTKSSNRSPRPRDILLLPGFNGKRNFTGNGRLPLNYGICSVCGEGRVIQTLLLQTNHDDEDTPHFPAVGSNSRHKYPLVLGSYPETDVILPMMSCDACALLMLKEDTLPNGDRVDVALPLVSLGDAQNRLQWLEGLNQIFENRFHEQIVFLVFLSSLRSTLDDLVDNDELYLQSLARCLEWCCNEICHYPTLSAMAGLTCEAGVHDTSPFEATLRRAISPVDPIRDEAPLLSYPLEGFTTLVHLASLSRDIPATSIRQLVWKRLLHHLAEQHVAQRDQVGVNMANRELRRITWPISGASDPAAPRAPILSLPLPDLGDTYLLPGDSDALGKFKRMGHFFTPINTTKTYHVPLAVFLHILLRASVFDEDKTLSAGELMACLRHQANNSTGDCQDLRCVFDHPERLVEANAVRLMRSIYCL
jgi:hypothetical protein